MASSNDKPSSTARLLLQKELNELRALAKVPPLKKSNKWHWENFDAWPIDRPSDADLRRAIEEEAKLKKRLRRLANTSTQERLKACRAWWRAVQGVLEQFAIRRRADSPGSPEGECKIPGELLLILSGFAGYLAVGQIPAPIEWVTSKKKGRRATGPTEQQDIRWAASYRDAVEDGRIRDDNPAKTVADAYGAEARTAQGWLKKTSAVEGSAKMSGEVIKCRMRNAGKRYQVSGRSRKAIAHRDPRKRESK